VLLFFRMQPIWVYASNRKQTSGFASNCKMMLYSVGVCGMDFLISDGSERFLTKVGRFGSEFGSVRNPKKTAVRFGKHRKYCIKFQKTHIQIQTGAHAML
jgi:hypothetical protein